MSRAMREDDSPALFGRGIGTSTAGNITCEFCGTDYTDREDETGDRCWGEGIGVEEFAGKQVLDCCWERIEDAVLRRMGDILPWYRKILARQAGVIAARQAELEKIATLGDGTRKVER